MTSLRLAELVAIDVHAHAEVSRQGHSYLPPELVDAASAYFKVDVRRPTLPEIAAYYRERSMAAVVFTVDSVKRESRVSNEEIAEQAVPGTVPSHRRLGT